ncbi:hypothetical protein WM40_26345 [Robbsia andropogonis]|uniref:Uncharacterized protein n=1 Tax=Robbsia andropogonis TaxID=28092 RepID=A0A0F5JU92_9BURK|nr:hypothetical protein WM40_26345 [Robbsia andropogonis]
MGQTNKPWLFQIPYLPPTSHPLFQIQQLFRTLHRVERRTRSTRANHPLAPMVPTLDQCYRLRQ